MSGVSADAREIRKGSEGISGSAIILALSPRD
jgi:hypothetical protein